MSLDVVMPQLGESVTEGTIARWLKAPGDRVDRYEPVVEVITDKVTAEVPAPASGILGEILVPEGQTVEVGRVLATIIAEVPAEAEAMTRVPSAQSASPTATERGHAVESVPMGDGSGTASHQPAVVTDSPAPTIGPDDGGARRSSPLVRRLAREHGVDLAQIQGTGLGGRVTKDDILTYIARRDASAGATPTPTVAAPPPSPVSSTTDAGDQDLKVTPIRRSIAQRMVQSAQAIPAAWLMVEADVTGLVRLRERIKEEFHRRTGVDLTYLPFFAKAVVESLREHPILNSTWADDRIIIKGRVNLGIAVALEDALVVPVLHDADRLSIAGLAQGIAELVGRARSGRLEPGDVQGGTFTLNNSGAFGSIASRPIINYPQAAILNTETIVKRPVVVSDGSSDAIAIRSMVNLCLAFDHRVMDGLPAGRFMQSVRRRLEQIGPDTSVY